MTLAYLAVEEPSGWIPIGISLVAVAGTIANYLLTLYRGKKRVRLKSSRVWEEEAGIYRCLVTNTGYIGVEIYRVELRRSAESSLGILLHLSRDEQPRKLDQGESQAWEMSLDVLRVGFQGETNLIAVAVDTTGKEYVQKRKDAEPIRGAQ